MAIVLGYHGTTPEAAERILSGVPFKGSRNISDWLGDGAYFFQDAPYRAQEWPTIRLPEHKRITNPVVLCAEIELIDCLDLVDINDAAHIKRCFVEMKRHFKRTREKLPRNRGRQRLRDRAVVNFAVEELGLNGIDIGVVRAAFIEGQPIVPGSKLYSHAHIQIVVRPNRMELIKDVWLHDFEKGEK